MFEKEAEIYTEEYYYETPKQFFLAGAKIGYNKANKELQKAKKIIQEFLDLNYSEFTKTNAVFLHADKFLKESF